jgi:hypothetical protein
MTASDSEKLRDDFEEWFRTAGVERVVGASLRLTPPPAALLGGMADDDLLVVQPARITAGQLSAVFGLTNWAAAGLETVSQATVPNDVWFTTPATPVAPYLGETPEHAGELAAATGRAGMTLEQYVVFAARYRAVKGDYPDVHYWTWLLRSHERSLVLFAGFDSHGNLQINSCTSDYRDDNTGTRLITIAA